MNNFMRNGFPSGIVGRFYEKEALPHVDVLSVSSQPNPQIELRQLDGADARVEHMRAYWQKHLEFLERSIGNKLNESSIWIYHVSICRYSPGEIRKKLHKPIIVSDIEYEISKNAKVLVDKYVTSLKEVSSIISREMGIKLENLVPEEEILVTDISNYL